MNEYSLTLDFVLGQTIITDVSRSDQLFIIKILISSLEGEGTGEDVSRNLYPHTHRHPWKTSSSIIRIV